MALLLWVAGALAFASRQPGLGAAIWIVVLVNGGFSFWRESRAQQAMQALRRLLPAYARAVRQGTETQVLASELVPGDVLILAEGDQIPADARLVEAFGLRTNNAVLTGEAVPARKSAEASLDEALTELERPNLVFAGTSVVSGTGRAVVHATGMLTQFGRIANLTQQAQEPPSPLQIEMRRATRRMSWVAIAAGAAVLLVSRIQLGYPLPEALVLSLGILVAAVPEGLSPTITLTLASAVQRLARHSVWVRRLAVLETLGTVSVLCIDKSGTLTQNQMTIREAWAGGHRFRVSGVGYDPRGELIPNPHGADVRNDIRDLLTVASLCNNSRLNPPTPQRPQWTCLGDQTEAALRVLAIKGGLDEEKQALLSPRIHEFPFDARRKRMTTIHRDARGVLACIKGAPREVLQLCAHISMQGKRVPLDGRLRTEILGVNDEFARRALRVLALAQRELPARTTGLTVKEVEQDLTFLGLVAMMDPPRPEIAGAIEAMHEAGIRQVMITGDYGLTAESLARRVGMLVSEHPVILTGGEFEAMSDAEIQALLRREEVVFARMAPDQKLRLVDIFQSMGEVVAVTGDGVNDAPALRRADVGIAMGIAGTDVAKEAADIVLTDDDFAHIPMAIAEGRAVYNNLRKFISYIFASNVPELVPFFLTALVNFPLALRAHHILAIDLGTDLLPALALGAEEPEPDLMRQPPRRRARPILEAGLLRRAFLWRGAIEAGLCLIGFVATYLAFGYGSVVGLPRLNALASLVPLRLPLAQVHMLATTVYLAGVVTAQVGNAFATRTENGGRAPGIASNPLLLIGIASEIGLILALVYVPPLQTLFGLQPLPWMVWPVLLLYALILYGVDRIARLVVRQIAQGRQAAGQGG
jgi:magnesium-transporting ATPase (P-type)